jgi:putative sterol carrier protein
MKSLKEFFEKLPEKVSPESIENVETIFHFNFSDDGSNAKTVRIEKGVCVVEEGLNDDPECVISGKSESFLKVLNGELNPMMALMSGKVKVSNSGAMIKYAKIFGVM